MMDTTRQLHALEATGWKRGVYDDVQHTFRAPVVNWIFRTAMANEPEFTRFAWAQVKPVFETRAFADLTVAYRDAVLSALEADAPLPTYRRTDAGVSPAEYAELRGQLATFDIVGPRLAVLFEVMDRALHDREVGSTPATNRAATAPFPEHLDRDRGRPPSMVDEPPEELADTVDRIRTFHGFGDSLPSIYRCLAQWPAFTERLWADLEPRFESAAFDDACTRVGELVDGFVDAAPYRPQLSPAVLDAAGFEEGTITDAQELFAVFNSSPVETVLPALPVFAATVGAEGTRSS